MDSPGVTRFAGNLNTLFLQANVSQDNREQYEREKAGNDRIKKWALGPQGKEEARAQPWPHHTDGKPVAQDGVMDNPRVMYSAGRVRLSIADYNRLLAETLRLARGENGVLKEATAQKAFTNPHPVSPHSLSGWVGFRNEVGAKGLVLAHDGSHTFNYCGAGSGSGDLRNEQSRGA